MKKVVCFVLTIGSMVCTFALIFPNESAKAKGANPPKPSEICLTNYLTKPLYSDCDPYREACAKGHTDKSLRIHFRVSGTNSYTPGPIVMPNQTECEDTSGMDLTDVGVEYKTVGGRWRQKVRIGGDVGGRDHRFTCTNDSCTRS